MKFLLDENLSPLHARTVRDLGHDAVSVVEIGLSGADDLDVRAAAIEQERILVTLDADFANVLRYPPAGTRASCGSASIPRLRRRSTRCYEARFPVWLMSA